MTRDDIIHIALEAGFTNVRGGLTDNGELSDYWDCWPKQLERFAALVAAAERQAIWDILFEYAGREDLSDSDQSLLKHLAELIRARTQA